MTKLLNFKFYKHTTTFIFNLRIIISSKILSTLTHYRFTNMYYK